MILNNVLNKTNSLGIVLQNYNQFFYLSKLLARTLVPVRMEPFASPNILLLIILLLGGEVASYCGTNCRCNYTDELPTFFFDFCHDS